MAVASRTASQCSPRSAPRPPWILTILHGRNGDRTQSQDLEVSPCIAPGVIVADVVVQARHFDQLSRWPHVAAIHLSKGCTVVASYPVRLASRSRVNRVQRGPRRWFRCVGNGSAADHHRSRFNRFDGGVDGSFRDSLTKLAARPSSRLGVRALPVGITRTWKAPPDDRC